MRLVTTAIAVLALLGCAVPEYRPPDYSRYVWPSPPQKPRVQLLHIIATDLDVRGRTAAEALFGEEVSFAFYHPKGIAADKVGNIFVSDVGLRRVFIINLQQKSIKELFNPYGWTLPGAIAMDTQNNVMAITNGGRVHLFRGTKLYATVGQRGEFRRAGGVALDAQRKILYVSDVRGHTVKAFSYDGKFLRTITTSGAEPGKVFAPTGLAVDRQGRVYVVDSLNFRLQVFNPDGTLVTTIGGHGTAPGSFARPKFVAVNQDGMILVTDAAFGNFQIFDLQGRLYLFVGSPGRGPGMFNIPEQISVDDEDRIYVTDYVNRRVQIFQLMTDRWYAQQEAKRKTQEQATPPAQK